MIERVVDHVLTNLALPVPGYPGYYATRRGMVLHVHAYPPTEAPATRHRGRKPDGVPRRTGQRSDLAGISFLTPYPHKRDGRLYVAVYVKGIGKRHRFVPQFVALAHLGPPPDGMYLVAHEDGIVSHNEVTNLRWSDDAGNTLDRLHHKQHGYGTRRLPRSSSATALRHLGRNGPLPPRADDPIGSLPEPSTYTPDPELGF